MARSPVQHKRQKTWLVRTRFRTRATFLAIKELNVAAQSNQHFNNYILCMIWYIANIFSWVRWRVPSDRYTGYIKAPL